MMYFSGVSRMTSAEAFLRGLREAERVQSLEGEAVDMLWDLETITDLIDFLLGGNVTLEVCLNIRTETTETVVLDGNLFPEIKKYV